MKISCLTVMERLVVVRLQTVDRESDVNVSGLARVDSQVFLQIAQRLTVQRCHLFKC